MHLPGRIACFRFGGQVHISEIMKSIHYLIFSFILPVVLCSSLYGERLELRATKIGEHRFAGDRMAHRPLKPSLKIRNNPPRTMELSLSQSTVLECEASGNPPAAIQWHKDGKKIPMTVYEIMHPENREEYEPIPPLGLSTTHSRLYLDCVGPRDEGLYSCVAENAFNKTSKKTVLTVTDVQADDVDAMCLTKKASLSLPARINMWSANRLELIGNDAKLFCRSEGLPIPKTTWLGPDNKPISTHSGRFEVMENGDLLIRKVEWSDMGDYMCQVENFHGSDSTRTFLYPTQPSKANQ